MQFASFDLRDPVFEAFGLRFSVQLVTLENLYGIDPERTRVERTGDSFHLRAAGLTWAGRQERSPGELELELRTDGNRRIRASLRARAPERIRCTKLLLRDLDDPAELPPHGQLWIYPKQIPAPVVSVRFGGESIGVRAEDPSVREKRFAAYRERAGPHAGRGVLELIHEESAPAFSTAIESPAFVIERGARLESLESEHATFLERAYGLRPWCERGDVPDWTRELRLVVVLHGMHWTGRVFLSYAEMLEVLRFVAARIDGRRVLAYLPGWEGRYYWQYGDYRPEPRLGGEAGFARLCEGARELGVHVMPMFGANCANAWLPRFRGLDPAVHLKSATGSRFHGNLPDWDLARAHDTSWQAWLNPGHPWWRDELAAGIEDLARRFGFDAVFLDTTEIWTNDADHSVFDGLRALADRLRSNLPGVLLAGEYDYDALLAVFPLFQRAWWTRAPAWTARFVRRFGHLCEGEPEGRTGVHELGFHTPGAVRAGDGLLATLAFQDGTLERSRNAVEQAIAAARAEPE
jgi:hypothetical protein